MLVKNDEFRGITHGVEIENSMSENGLNLPCTLFLVIVRPQGLATSITHVNAFDIYLLGIFQW